MANKNMKRYSRILIIRKTQIETTSHPLERPLLKHTKQKVTSYWQGCVQTGIILHCWWKCKMLTTTENSMVILRKIK